jgi:dienelactone hydrolase
MTSLILICMLGAPGDEAFEAYLKAATAKMQKRFLAGAKSAEQWKRLRPKLHAEYLDMLGIDLKAKRTPLKATVTGTLKRDTVTIEKLHFQSLPGLYVTGNLYRLTAVKGRLPTVLYVCGHSGRGRDGNKTAFQDHGMWFARNGYVCLVIDTLQLGEVKGIHHGTYNLNKWHWHSLGYTPAGVECWNGIRAIDYLISRPDVDPDRIGVTGISGGGAVTVWISAADDRVKVAVPVSGMSDLESYVTNKVINGHCDCMFMANLYGWEWTTIAALIAPRPLLFANSDNDRIFPMDGNRRIIARLRQLYKMLDKPDNVDDHVSKGGHDYRPDLRIAIFKFLNKHLKGDGGPVKDTDDKPLPGKDLRVFPTDDDLPKDSINDKIDETFIKVAKLELPSAKGGGGTWTRNKRLQVIRALTRFPGQPAEFKLSEKDRATHRLKGDKTRGLLWVTLEDPAKAEKAALAAAKEADVGTLVIVAPRGCGGTAFTRKSPPNTIERSLFLLGETLDRGRLRDVNEERGQAGRANPGVKRWVIGGEGQAGVIAAYASSASDEVYLVRPTTTHRDGPHFPGILRVTDIPEVLGLLAPRKLTIVGDKGKAFDHTAKLYELAGAKEKFIRK